MLNKELLLATEGQTAGHIKLTVGQDSTYTGYYNMDSPSIGAVNKTPTWNLTGKPVAMVGMYTHYSGSTILFDLWSAVDATSITATVVEKGLTATFIKTTDWLIGYFTDTKFFNSSDVGKTYTIVFDPEPTSYV